MIMCVLLCYPVSIRIYYQQGILFLVCDRIIRCGFLCVNDNSLMIVSGYFGLASATPPPPRVERFSALTL